jgi:hypothetical protein
MDSRTWFATAILEFEDLSEQRIIGALLNEWVSLRALRTCLLM